MSSVRTPAREDGISPNGHTDHAPARRLATETKASFKTTEFVAFVAVLVGILIAAAVVDEADAGGLGAKQAWLYVTILTVGYMVSRGLAKAGSRAALRRGPLLVEPSRAAGPIWAGGAAVPYLEHPNLTEADYMSRSEQKVVQYLNEAHASEMALVRVLQSQIAMTPRGTYRSGLETHLGETRNHAERVQTRLGELGQGGNPLQFLGGVAETVAGQALALAKTPLDLVRGSGGEEKVLKNAKDACATEALEIATYTAIERLARSVGDEQTAKLAASIRADEEKMLERILREIPKLTGAVVGADIEGDPSYELTKTGAADAARATGKAAAKTARKTGAKAKRSTRQARKVPGVAQAEGQVKGAVASQSDLAIAGYDKLTAEEIVAKLSELSQIDLAKVDSYERRHENRTTVLERVSSLRGDEPWPGYDELTAAEVQTAARRGRRRPRQGRSAPTSAPTRPAPAS